MAATMVTPGEQLAALIEELREVLEEERRALLGGTPAVINEVTQRKLLLAEQIEEATLVPGATRPDPALLQSLARYNQQNAVICAAMQRHLSAAIDSLRRQDPHRSYRADGSEGNHAARHALGAA